MRNKKGKKDYSYESLRDERKYGFYWYSALWRVLRPLLVAAASLTVVVGIAAMAWNWAYANYLAPTSPEDAAEVIFVVESGNSLTRVANNLEANNLVRNRTVFKYYCDFLGYSQKIQAGEYTLSRQMTIDEIANKLTTGDGKPIARTITVIPGKTIEDIAADLFESGAITSKEEFLALCKTGAEFANYDYIDKVIKTPNSGQRKYMLEGYLAPNTYEVYTNATSKDIINTLLKQTNIVLTSDDYDRAEQLGYSIDQIITLASMIEKEAKSADFARVSAVFHNRLRQNMKLQSDVTIHYITGVRKMALKNSDLAIESPYNTYQNTGLPLGPVCNPSPAAIQAALYPDESFIAENYLYFCSTDLNTGALYFSKTLEEHQRAVDQYSHLWEAYDKERGL